MGDFSEKWLANPFLISSRKQSLKKEGQNKSNFRIRVKFSKFSIKIFLRPRSKFSKNKNVLEKKLTFKIFTKSLKNDEEFGSIPLIWLKKFDYKFRCIFSILNNVSPKMNQTGAWRLKITGIRKSVIETEILRRKGRQSSAATFRLI